MHSRHAATFEAFRIGTENLLRGWIYAFGLDESGGLTGWRELEIAASLNEYSREPFSVPGSNGTHPTTTGGRVKMQSRASLGKLAETLQGVPVWGCLPGSVAKEAGIRYGDVVMQVNGQRTRDIDEYLAARELREDGADIVVFRNGIETTVQLVFRQRPAAEQAPDRLVEEIVRERLIPIQDEDEASEAVN